MTEIEFSNFSRRAFAQCGGASFSGFEIDPETGESLSPAIPNGSTFTGLEAIGPRWYGASITEPVGPSTLYALDPFTGSSTPIGPTGVDRPLSGIAFDQPNGAVYAISAASPNSNLYTLDLTTGVAYLVGATGIVAGSLEFGPDGRLYAGGGGPDAGRLYVVDRLTGVATLVGETGFGTLSGLMLVDRDCNYAANPFLNCGFESGDFTSWITQDHPQPYFPMTVIGAGLSPGFSLFTSDPTEGTQAALHGFDGFVGSPAHIRIAQDVTIPGRGTLEFDYRAGWDLVTLCTPPCADRSFDVVVEPAGGGAPLATTHILTVPGETMQLDTGAQVGRVDLGPFAGQLVRVVFDWFVPEAATGPAFFQLDDVRLETPVGYFTVAPCRVIDTRSGYGPLAGPALAAGGDRSFTIAGACGIPPSAKAISVNIAVTGATTRQPALACGGERGRPRVLDQLRGRPDPLQQRDRLAERRGTDRRVHGPGRREDQLHPGRERLLQVTGSGAERSRGSPWRAARGVIVPGPTSAGSITRARDCSDLSLTVDPSTAVGAAFTVNRKLKSVP